MARIIKTVGEKVSLGIITPDDISKIVEMANDFQTSDGLGYSDCTASYTSIRENTESEIKRERPIFVIIENDSQEPIGYCRLTNTEYLHKIASLIIGIDMQNQNKGYGEDAVGQLVDYAFSYLNFNNIMITVYSFNKQAIRCYEKVGFKKIGERTQSHYLNGKWYSTIYMEIVKDDFKGNYIKNKINY